MPLGRAAEIAPEAPASVESEAVRLLLGHERVAHAAGRAWADHAVGTGGGRPVPEGLPVPLAEIREALTNARIHNRYQPVVRIADRRPLGLEVLARLEHPDRGTLAPDLFVPQIEDAGLAFQLTQAVVRRTFVDWSGAALERLDLWLALNFPLDVLLLPEALAWLDAERRAAGIPVERIGIELTESRPVTDGVRLGRVVADLRRAGYTLVIDDVGPGVRQAEDLLALGFSVLKLDKGLVHGSSGDAKLAGLLGGIVAAAHAAGLLVVAEGVETADMWAQMQAAGVEQAQGFLIARPMLASAVPEWHRDWSAGAATATN